MRQPRVGDVVLHYMDPRAKPAPAFVTEVGTRGTLDMSVVYKDSQGFEPKSGVPHVSDTDYRDRLQDQDIGFWDWPDGEAQAKQVAPEAAPAPMTKRRTAEAV